MSHRRAKKRLLALLKHLGQPWTVHSRPLEPSPELLTLGDWHVVSQPRKYRRPKIAPFDFKAYEMLLLGPKGRVYGQTDPQFDLILIPTPEPSRN